MQKKFLILITALSSLASCSLLKGSCSQELLTEKDSLSVIYSDSIDSIFTNANKIRLYDMGDFIIPGDSVEYKDSLFKYEIKKDIGFLDRDKKNILRFIISDKYWFIKRYAPVKQPFNPNIALKFHCKNRVAFMFISFGTEEIAIATIDGKFKFYQMRDKRIMARWSYMLFPEEEYYKKLIN